MSEFMDRARAEAEQTIDHMGEGAWADGVRYGIYVGVASAAEQEPTDAEIEVVARALFEDEVGPGNIAYYWGDRRDTDLRQHWLDLARAVLLAAQKVRAGQ